MMGSGSGLRILHTESSCGWGGQEIRILNEAAGFISRGHQVELVCSPLSEIAIAAAKQQIPVHTLPIEKKKTVALWVMRQWLSENQTRFDLINTHSSTDSWLCALANLTLPNSLPIVRTRHVSTPVNTSFATKWLYQSATGHIVTTGERLRERLAIHNGFDLKRMTSVPTGVNFQQFFPMDKTICRTKLGLPVDTKLLGIVATLRDWKGHCYLFEALADLAHDYPNCHLVVVGDGPYEQKLRDKVQSLQLEQRILFVGRQDNVVEWLNSFDIFCLPSYGEEGVPQSILQAMACGLPVISTPIGSIDEAVLDGETGILVSPRDAVALASALRNLLENTNQCQVFGQAAMAHVLQHFSYNGMLNKMEQVFRSHLEHL